MSCNSDNAYASGLSGVRESLRVNGYAVVPGVLRDSEVKQARSLFFEWMSQSPDMRRLHKKISPHGIIKHGAIGGSKFLWFVRTRPRVQNLFRAIWGQSDLVTSLDGACYIPGDWNSTKLKDTVWTHFDQNPSVQDLQQFVCAQAYVSLTDNASDGNTTLLYEGSHLDFAEYGRRFPVSHRKNWVKADPAWLSANEHKKRYLTVPAGSMVIWDSRVAHQSVYGSNPKERLVAYVCFLPKNGKKNTQSMAKKRLQYVSDRRTTSHWPYPISVNAKQPRNYGDKTLSIDYDNTPNEDLSEYSDLIKKIV